MNQATQTYRNPAPNVTSASQADGVLQIQFGNVKSAAALVDQLRTLEQLIFGPRPEKVGPEGVAPMPDGFFPQLESASNSLTALLSNAAAIAAELVQRFQSTQPTTGISAR